MAAHTCNPNTEEAEEKALPQVVLSTRGERPRLKITKHVLQVFITSSSFC